MEVPIETIKNGKRCMVCNRKMIKGEKAFRYFRSRWDRQVSFRVICIDCHLEAIYELTNKKYLRPKIIKEIQERMVARRI